MKQPTDIAGTSLVGRRAFAESEAAQPGRRASDLRHRELHDEVEPPRPLRSLLSPSDPQFPESPRHPAADARPAACADCTSLVLDGGSFRF
jgi:hypothetical protein